MSQNEAIALVQELGGSPEHIARLRAIRSSRLSSAHQTSVLTNLASPPASVPLASLETFTPAPRTRVDEVESTEEHGPVGPSIPQRYEGMGQLGKGGMGEVRASAIWDDAWP